MAVLGPQPTTQQGCLHILPLRAPLQKAEHCASPAAVAIQHAREQRQGAGRHAVPGGAHKVDGLLLHAPPVLALQCMWWWWDEVGREGREAGRGALLLNTSTWCCTVRCSTPPGNAGCPAVPGPAPAPHLADVVAGVAEREALRQEVVEQHARAPHVCLAAAQAQDALGRAAERARQAQECVCACLCQCSQGTFGWGSGDRHCCPAIAPAHCPHPHL